MFFQKKQDSTKTPSSLDSFKLYYEELPTKKQLRREAMKKAKAAKTEALIPKVPKDKKCTQFDVRTYTNFKRWAFPVSLEFCSVKSTKALVINILFLEITIFVKRIKR